MFEAVSGSLVGFWTDDSVPVRAGVDSIVAAFQENKDQSKRSFTRPFSSDNDEDIEYILFSVDTSTPDPHPVMSAMCSF